MISFKYYFLTITLFLNLSSYSFNLIEIRSIFYGAIESKKDNELLVNILDEYNDEINPLIKGYKGVAFMLMSKHSINPLQKLKLFTKGKDMLENSIKDNKWNVELRFLRHSIQSNVPAFLNYSSSLTEDKSIILSNLHSIEDLDLKQMIKFYILKSKSFDLQEKQIIL